LGRRHPSELQPRGALLGAVFIQEGYGDCDPINSLAFLRAFLPAMIEISEDLNLEEDKRETWRHILAHLSDLPTHAEDGRKRFRACEGGNGSAANQVGLNWIMLHGLVFPATNIGLSSEAEQLQMVRDDMKRWNDRIWLDHGNALQTLFIAAARVGHDPDLLLASARQKIEKYAYPNLWITARGGGIETCSGIPGMVNEMMLQTHGGVMRVFPVFPDSQRASFARLRTFGAFLVSSTIADGRVQYVVIESEKGRDGTLANPWPNETVRVVRNGAPAAKASGERLHLTTAPGERILLTPQDTELADIEWFGFAGRRPDGAQWQWDDWFWH